MAAHKKKPTLSRAIINLLFVVPAFVSLMGKVINLLGSEARLAGRSMLSIILLIILFGVVFTSTWLCVLAVLFVYLTSLHWDMEWSLLFLILINIVLMLIIGMVMNKFKRRLLFTATRSQLRQLAKLNPDG